MADAEAGRRHLVVSGPPGVGKTAVLDLAAPSRGSTGGASGQGPPRR